VALGDPEFEWDARKATANRNKHGVTFAEAETVFRDPLAAIHDDPTALRLNGVRSSLVARPVDACW